MSEALSLEELEELEEITELIAWKRERNQIAYFEPYPWQIKMYDKEDDNGELAMQRLAMCANRVGKTFGGCAETTYHATGVYPEFIL